MDQSEDTAIARATAEAEALVAQIQSSGGDLGPAYAALEQGIAEFEETGHEIDEIVPPESEQGLGFWRLSDRSGKAFWQAYGRAARTRLCDPDGPLRAHVMTGTQASLSVVVGAVFTALALPVTAVAIAAGIAAILLSIGIDAYCDISDDTRITA